MGKELETLVTTGDDEEEHGMEELPAEIVTTRELNNKRRKLQQRTKRKMEEGKRQRQTRAREQVPNSSSSSPSSSSSSSSSSKVLPGDAPGIPVILNGEEPVGNPNRSLLGSNQLDVTEMVSTMPTCSECGISKEFLQAMLKLVRPHLTKDDSLLEKFLNGEAIDRDAFMTRMYFGVIEQHVGDESNSDNGAMNNFNSGAKLAGSFGSVQEKLT